MRPVVWSVVTDGPAFTVADGARIEVTSASPEAAAIVARLDDIGYAARLVTQPSGQAAATILTEGLAAGEPAHIQWTALQAAKAARREGGVTLLLQPASTPAGLEGLSRTLRKEWPESRTFAWTVAGLMADTVADALEAGHADGIVTLQGALVVPNTGAPVLPSPMQCRADNNVWLITGGARGVTADCAIELAHQSGGTILLAGRSAETPWPDDLPAANSLKDLRGPLVERSRKNGQRVTPADIDRTARALLAGAEIRATLAAIRSSGARAAYLPLDAGDAGAVARTLADVQSQYGAITGLVHGAGVLADRLAMEKTETELRRVFAPKVDGLSNILAALDPGKISHLALFSSAAAFFGNKGQSDYAMANALLASAGRAFAAAHPQAQVKVFHWGPWAGGMVDDTLAGHFAAQGIPLIPVDEGARIFATELLTGPRDQVELVVGEAWAAT